MGWSWQCISYKKIVLDNGCINTGYKGNYFISWFNVVSLGTPLDDQPKEPEVSNPEALSAENEKDMSLPGKILQTIDWNNTLSSERGWWIPRTITII